MSKTRLGFTATRKNKYFFVSYSRNDAERVSAYTSQLCAHGIPLWYDSGLPGGKDWWAKIKEKLHNEENSKKKCLGVLLFLSKELFQRKNSYVFHEFYWAINGEDTTAAEGYTTGRKATEWKLDVYPIFLDDVTKEDIPYDFPEEKVPDYVTKRDDWHDIYAKWYDDISRSHCPYERAEKQVYNRVVSIINSFDEDDTDLNDFSPAKLQEIQLDEAIPMPGRLLFSGSYIKKEENAEDGTFLVTGKGIVTKQTKKKTVFTYEGDVADGMLSGYGRITWEGDKVYEGEIYKGKRHGYGVTTYANGDVYKGRYVSDKRHGKGEYLFSGSGNSYNGYFADDLFNGEGTFTWKSGDTFTGMWVNGKKKGKGILIKDGIKMKANWDGNDGEIIDEES